MVMVGTHRLSQGVSCMQGMLPHRHKPLRLQRLPWDILVILASDAVMHRCPPPHPPFEPSMICNSQRRTPRLLSWQNSAEAQELNAPEVAKPSSAKIHGGSSACIHAVRSHAAGLGSGGSEGAQGAVVAPQHPGDVLPQRLGHHRRHSHKRQQGRQLPVSGPQRGGVPQGGGHPAVRLLRPA